jgi:formylglycine-generating enzyme required for sulfatase activity
VLATGAGCDDPVGDPRPQLVIVVDTDAIVQGQLASDPSLSAASALDTLRVDVVAADGSNTAYDLPGRTFIAPESRDWPLSFGVAAAEAAFDRPVRLRLRLFAGKYALSGDLAGQATLDPPPTVTIDRLIEVVPPEEGKKIVLVTLTEDCLGVPTYFPDPPQTCVDDARRRVAPSEGLEEVASATGFTSVVGTWERARAVPCSASAPPSPDALCVPGGFSVLGRMGFEGLPNAFVDATPLRPVELSPFWMDRTEVTVGRFRQMLEAGLLPADLVMPFPPEPSDRDRRFCTWLADDTRNDALPLNCISDTTALDVCIAAGGDLPSEAQWEHAATGRGAGTLYPWGDDVPRCCMTSISRNANDGNRTECDGSGIEPVGSHPASDSCGGLGDVSRDGILDLAGSVSETLRDVPQRYDATCWLPEPGQGILRDHVCEADSFDRSARGGYWNSGRLVAAIPFRNSASTGSSTGFRCVYRDGAAP